MSGFIWSALGQGIANAGSAAAGMMAKGIEEERQQSFRERMLELQAAKQEQLARLSAQLQVETARNMIPVESERADAAAQSTLRNAPILAQATVARTIGEAPAREMLASERVAEAANTTRAQTTAQTEGLIERNSNPEFIKGVKAVTAASHYFGPQDELAREQLKKLQAVTALQTQLSNTTDEAEREKLTQKLNDLQGTPKSKNDLRLALVQTEKAMSGALKTLADPMSSEDAKQQARESIDTLNLLAGQLKGQLGLGGAAIPQGAIDALKKDPNLAAQFDAKYGAGSSKKYLGK